MGSWGYAFAEWSEWTGQHFRLTISDRSGKRQIFFVEMFYRICYGAFRPGVYPAAQKWVRIIMQWIVFFSLILALSLGCILWLRRRRIGATPAYRKAPALLTAAERSFFGALEQAVTGHFRTMIKVRLADVIRPEKGSGRGAYAGAFNRISRKHLDFVLCDPGTMAVRAAVELDDGSHQRADRKERDRFLQSALESAGIPLYRFSVQRGYEIEPIREALGLVVKSHKPPQMEAEPEDAPRLCPECGGKLVERVSKKGKYAGQRFLGCSNFPDCREIFPIGADKT
jgi:hypothetical protein